MKMAKKDQVWHLVQRGLLMQLHIDFEATSLKTSFAQITSYGDALGDFAGNLVDSVEYDVRRPDRHMPNPVALVVTRTSVDELDRADRLNHREAISRIAQRIETGPGRGIDLSLPSTNLAFHTVRKKGETLKKTAREEVVLHYPLIDTSAKTEIGPDGRIAHDPTGSLSLNAAGELCMGAKQDVLLFPVMVAAKGADGKPEWTVVHRPMRPEDGRVDFSLRLHPERGMIAYRFDENSRSPYYENIENDYYLDDADGSKWRLMKPRLAVSGFNIKSYDFPVLRTNLVRAGFHPRNIFFTHSQAAITATQLPKNYAIDAYRVVANVHLYGPQGAEGLRIGRRKDSETGQDVPSAKLELVMQANMRFGNPARGVIEGVRMPHDGSIYNKRLAHRSPAYDSLASYAISTYARHLAPDVVRHLELQADDQVLRMLSQPDLTDPRPPVYTMLRNSYPNDPTVDPVAFLGLDDQQGQLRKAITIRLDHDLRRYRYNGKSLVDMAREFIRDPENGDTSLLRMMREQGRGPDALIRIESIRRWPGVMPIHMAVGTRAAQGWDLEAIDDSFRFLMQNDDLLDAIRHAVEVRNRDMRRRHEPANALMEQQATHNGFGNLDLLEGTVRADALERKYTRPLTKGMASQVIETIYHKATAIYDNRNTVDEILHRLAVQPHPVEYDDGDDALKNYQDLFKKMYRRLSRDLNSPYAAIFDDYLDAKGRLAVPTLDQARQFRWDLMRRLLNDDEAQRNDRDPNYRVGLFDHNMTKGGRILFGNLARNFRVVDEQGRVLPFDYLEQAHPHIVQRKLENKSWRIQFYRLSSAPSIMATLDQFALTGRNADLPPIWRHRLEAWDRLMVNGPPGEDAANILWEAIPTVERDLKSLEINARSKDNEALSRLFSESAAGDAESFLRSDEGQRIVIGYRAFLDRQKQRYPLTRAYSQMLRYDHDTGLPYDFIEHHIDRNACVIVDVPDNHLRQPLRDIRHGPNALIVPSLNDDDRQSVRRGAAIVLRGQETGRLYYGGRTSLRKAPVETEALRDFYEQARVSYQDANILFPPSDARDMLIVQDLMPIAGPGRSVPGDLQTLKVPSIWFDGLVAPRLAHFNRKLTGLAMPADFCPQRIVAGQPIRFREMQGTMWAKAEGADGAETGHGYVTMVKSAEHLTLDELRARIADKRFTDSDARRFGYAGGHDLWEKLNQGFVDRGQRHPGAERVLMIEFRPVQAKDWSYFNPPKAPKAVFTESGKPVPPSAYRWSQGSDNDNNNNNNNNNNDNDNDQGRGPMPAKKNPRGFAPG